MPNFQYKALDRKTNKEVKDSIEAANQGEAIAAIKRNGLLPIEVKEAKVRSQKTPGAAAKGDGGKGGGFSIPFLGGGVKAKQVTDFTRQLSTLTDAGLPMVQSLQILTDMQPPGPFKAALGSVSEEVQSGTMLSDGMSRYPKIWDKLYTNLIKAGESAGALETILRRLAEFREKAQRLKKKVIGALIYPIAVLTIAVGILTFIMVVIVPKFEQIFEELAIELPPLTEVLIGFSRFVGSYWWMIGLGIIFTFFGLSVFRRTDAGGAIVDRMTLRVPVLGNVIRKSSVARFTRTLGTLVTSGVGFLEALDITKSATPNIVVRNAIQDVRDSVKEGESINEPLARSGVFNDIVVNMIKVGEETGELDKMLVKIADNYDEEVDEAVAAMMALMEPLLIVFMGGAVGFIVIALFLPLIEIIDQIS
ncbi:MAG: type II secretion system F family protein [Planctomycetota bacterium]|nr:MAG: type II secretion system F family protein [Planctomycetota bacterium]